MKEAMWQCYKMLYRTSDVDEFFRTAYATGIGSACEAIPVVGSCESYN
jgi:hypothetical protein